MIYVIVSVTYDYYRFQENIGATTDFSEAKRIAEEYAKKAEIGDVITDAEHSRNMGEKEARHVWIEEFHPPFKTE